MAQTITVIKQIPKRMNMLSTMQTILTMKIATVFVDSVS